MGNSKRPRSKRTRTIVVSALVIVVAVAAVIAYLGLRGGDNSKVTYSTGTVQKMTLTSSVSGVGNVELTSSVTVDPGISGEVAELSVAVGDKVEQGQHLFTIINPQLDLEVANAQNNYNQAVLALEKAKLSVLQAQQNLADLYDQYEAQSTSTTQSTTPTTTTATSPTTSTTHSTT
ncbi:MAG: efflux RND transporter periplasmic adaptor subunit, partial [Thermoleophilia bacterium]|nr:efflux RND transporter periplasmic adaptor subunit [Thermoleophilia bacterium]